LRVKRKQHLAPNLMRITLSGDALAGFPAHSDGSHIKLMLPRAGQIDPVLPTLGPDGPIWPPADQRPIVRTYSVSQYHAEAGELDVDFVLHGDNGPASSWAIHAEIGAGVGVAGPGGPDRFQANADWFLLIGDLSAYAAIAAVCRALPDDARGHILLEISDETEQCPLPCPPGMTLAWLSRNGTRAGTSQLLLNAVSKLAWPSTPSVTLAGESTQIVAIRDWLMNEKGLPRNSFYAVPYWKDLQDEEAYHQERHRIMDEFEA
jgi:NADPH-dependent ferric siderophore reductase